MEGYLDKIVEYSSFCLYAGGPQCILEWETSGILQQFRSLWPFWVGGLLTDSYILVHWPGSPPLGPRLCELEDHSSKPTWDDCEQLLQVHFTTKKRQRILLEARKNVPGSDGRPSLLPVDIEARFPLTWPNWDFNTPEGPRGQDGTVHLDLITTMILELLISSMRPCTNIWCPFPPATHSRPFYST